MSKMQVPNSFMGKETDEMYTQFSDIVKELDHYPEELFLGKKILFPCDWECDLQLWESNSI